MVSGPICRRRALFAAAALLFLSFPAPTAHATCSGPEVEQKLELAIGASASENLRTEFSAKGKTNYVSAYNAGIVFGTVWQETTRMHLASMHFSGESPVIIDAGGGTGRVTQRLEEAVRQHYPGARIELLDLNPDMLAYAQTNGISPEHMHVSDITQMKLHGKIAGEGDPVEGGSVDHVICHSVIWMLQEPDHFFAEVARVLKHGGRLSVTTFQTVSPEAVGKFHEGIAHDMNQAVQEGKLSRETAEIMINANRALVAAKVSVLTPAQLIAAAEKAGLHPVGKPVPAYNGMFVFGVFEKP